MSNSLLVDYTKLSPNCTKPRKGKIMGISIHTMAGPGSIEGCGQVFQTTKASSHYGIGPDGRIGQYVKEENRAWCCSHTVDHYVVTIEVSSIQSYKEPYQCTAKAYQSLIDLCVDICKRNGIKQLIWKEGKKYCPAFTGNWSVCNLVPHRYTTDKGKSCPGNYLFGKYGDIAKEVNKRLKAPVVEPPKKEDQVENMDIDTFISKLTNKQAYEIARKAELYMAKLPEPEWSKSEEHWAHAKEKGLTDGTSPERYVKRDEMMAILGRVGLMENEK